MLDVEDLEPYLTHSSCQYCHQQIGNVIGAAEIKNENSKAGRKKETEGTQTVEK